ncbi:ferrochelatase [Solemya velum gill symbiont]|uniref:ferrochelatase n=1 Tax=Solemya velum gill symbiont TaxID=2340 RepID=UPI0009975D7B|nr:ferrochelatase [Solemya velum gill symbiont]OOY98674.1 ferrochelatase [Solemya velum gill symbiont]OOZ00971.1 ferrochelatase [Solemya velum gill symbiont]OOZ03163.1 ferrochelatase [Solemya velum gill symbiont]OOZ05416.1 ferrochelatase [Solemya velum gill symbiont]OOZ07655.1 ferrochelatase [Solemya velum gill symbiont]
MYDKAPFPDNQPVRTGILLVNLGTPDSASVSDVRRYLDEFLSDPRVVEVPRLLWFLILHLVILRIRPGRSAKAYQSVWSDEGSPLLAISRRQADKLQQQLDPEKSSTVVALGMRYGNPSIADALDELKKQNARRLLVLPLYPQYSASTVASVFDAVTDELQTWRWIPECRFINNYPEHPDYIEALAESVRQHREQHGSADKLLLSFHGIPQEYVDKGDPYADECRQTAEKLAQALNLDNSDWLQTFQSRVGNKPWLQPYTDATMKSLAAEGVKSVQVICPGFSVDCLETIEEIDDENRHYFLDNGGERFEYIPALNDSDDHIAMMSSLIAQHTNGWD